MHLIFIVVFIILIPILAIYCNKNEFVKETLHQGWTPVIIAMFISSMAGILLEFAIKIYNSVAIFQPVVNGVGGNLVGIFASRLSTSLHRTSVMGQWAVWAPKNIYSYPFETFFGKHSKDSNLIKLKMKRKNLVFYFYQDPEHKTALILQGLTIPGHLIFFFTIFYIKASQTKLVLTVWTALFYLIIAFLQVNFETKLFLLKEKI